MSKLHKLLQPYEPTGADPFDAVKAAHLLNRAGFGGTEAEVEKVRALGPAGAADWLLSFPDAGAEKQADGKASPDLPNFAAIENFPKNFRELRAMVQGKSPEERQRIRQMLMRGNREALMATSRWWLNRMAAGPYPLQEKLTLFWHGHFTTSFRDERSAWLIWRQNELLRRTAAGNFREFVKSISRDPAMLQYLNNNQNRKGRPNENYARELMELFTLGIGHYTEADVKEAARAFTGWASEGEEFVFRKNQHDDGVKRFFGKVGKLDGDDVIEAILRHKACAQYVAGKLFRFFAYEDPEQGLVEGLGQFLRDAKYDLRPLLKTIFRSKAFYSAKAVGGQIKSPIQLVIGTVRLLGLELPPLQLLQRALNQMGQVPFNPPNVKGWPGGQAWINTATLFARYNTCVFLAGGGGPGGGRRRQLVDDNPKLRLKAKFRPEAAGPAEETVDYWVARLIQRPIDGQKRRVLIDSLAGRPGDEEVVRQMVQL
ncbi:MAG TPA: DUF1800 domain-containing protein, partial [Ramlibacter sp.]|nr:DUF1800 domain-containing protein [Ramlibacter sp.]